MQIAKHKIVSIDYTLTDTEGNVLDTSDGQSPMSYIQGIGNLISGLEKALEGKAVGASLSVSVPPEEGYGTRDDAMRQAVPRDRFEFDSPIEIGMRFQAMGEAGPQVVTVVEVDEENVTIDTNHPLAGETLNFVVTVIDVREASPEELEHGHVHGPGGHDHD